VPSTTAKIVLPPKDVRGLVNSAIMLCLLVPTWDAQTHPLNVAVALETTNVVLDGAAIKELAWQVQATETVITTQIVAAAFQMRTVSGTLILSLIASPKSNAISLTEAWLWEPLPQARHLQQLASRPSINAVKPISMELSWTRIKIGVPVAPTTANVSTANTALAVLNVEETALLAVKEARLFLVPALLCLNVPSISTRSMICVLSARKISIRTH
jgi:hypothetical protein